MDGLRPGAVGNTGGVRGYQKLLMKHWMQYIRSVPTAWRALLHGRARPMRPKTASSSHRESDLRYVGGAVLAGTALVLTMEMARYADRTPFVFFYVAVALAALYYGFGPALLATGIGVLGVTYFVLRPTHSFRIERPADLLSIVAFAIVSYAASALTKSLRSARQRAEAAVSTASRQAMELVRANEELWRVTADAERARTEADQARAEAERANAAKSQFLAAMSHEIRTPINAVIGFAQLLQEGVAGPLTAQQQEYVRRIGVSSHHLSGLVSNILDLAKVEADRVIVAREAARLSAVVAEAVTLVRPMADARHVNLARPGASCLDEIWYAGDTPRVRQILVNLLSNAVKFTGPGGHVTVDCSAPFASAPATTSGAPDGPRWACVSVCDTGVGIRPEQLESIFEPFVQGTTTLTARAAGAGLGLTISRRLARLMGGDILVESTLGVGSVFTLWLPFATPVAAEVVGAS